MTVDGRDIAQARLRAAFFSLALFAGACATVRNPALESARDLYQKARQDPLVARYASASLDRAGQILNEADQRWTDDRDVIETDHLAYLATKRIEIARLTAQRRLAENEIRQSPAVRHDSNDSRVK
jgi:OmpA-OmpF porin, OOP family